LGVNDDGAGDDFGARRRAGIGPRAAMVTLPQRGEVSRAIFATTLSAPSLARHHATAALRKWELPADIIEITELVVSDLVTNAWNACDSQRPLPDYDGECAADEIPLTLRLLRDRLVVEVSDSDPYPPVRALADADSESGRGLMLVEALTKEWGFVFPPAGAKVVYAVISAPCLADPLKLQSREQPRGGLTQPEPPRGSATRFAQPGSYRR